MTLLVPWVLFPLVLVGVSWGCGLLVERLAGDRLPGALVPGVGLAALAVLGQFTSLADATAELATPVALALATAGLLLGWQAGLRRPDGWAAGCALAVFLLYVAPVLLSGEATLAGYIRLDDTASWP